MTWRGLRTALSSDSILRELYAPVLRPYFTALQPSLTLVSILGILNVDPSAFDPDRIDRPFAVDPLDEERRVRTILALASNHTFEIRLEHVVDEYENDVVSILTSVGKPHRRRATPDCHRPLAPESSALSLLEGALVSPFTAERISKVICSEWKPTPVWV